MSEKTLGQIYEGAYHSAFPQSWVCEPDKCHEASLKAVADHAVLEAQRQHQAEIERLRDLLKRARGFVRIVGQQVSDRAILESEIDAAIQKPVDKAP